MPSIAKMKIKGSEKYITKNAGQAIKIEDGRVFVFIVPFVDDKPGKRLFFAELSKGDVLPPLSLKAEFTDASDIRDWHFLILPMPEASIKPLAVSASHYKSIGEKLGRDYNKNNFADEVVESYRLSHVKEMRNIYAASKQTENAKKSSFRVMFEQMTHGKSIDYDNSPSQLFNAIETICHDRDINIVAFDTLKSVTSNNFGIDDIARLSGFPYRKVILTDKWYREDIGELLVYLDSTSNPLVARPTGFRGYKLVNPETGSSIRINEEVASHILREAICIYRPLPAVKMGFRDIINFVKKEFLAKDVVFIILLAIIGTLIGLLVPFLNEQIYDLFIPLGDVSGLKGICLVILSCMLGNVAFNTVRGMASFRGNSRMLMALEVGLYDRVFNLPDASIRDVENADLIQRLFGLSQMFSTIVNIVFTEGLSLVLSLIYLWKMWSYSPDLSKAGLVMALIAVIIMVCLSISGMKTSAKQMELDGKISSMLYQFLSGISKIRIAGAEPRALNEYIKKYATSIGYTRELRTKVNIGAIIAETARMVFSLVLFYLMIRNSLDISTGKFMGFNSAFTSFSAAILSISSAITNVGVMMPALKRSQVIVESIPETDSLLTMPSEITGEIELNNVSFGYNPESRLVLEDINLHIHPGEYIGIVGPSGCGKSTLLKLLLGFEKPSAGKIYYNGQDLDDMNKRQLRKLFGVVLQNGALISGSIFDNVRITSPNATAQDVLNALEKVGLKSDVEEMPMGLNTVLTEGTGQISGGQKQRVLIARAIINNPQILFMDEATSALDNITQAQVADSLAALNSTRIVIAHRLSTIIKCDRILVMNEGKIVEEGNFDELMKRGGLFTEFASRQM